MTMTDFTPTFSFLIAQTQPAADPGSPLMFGSGPESGKTATTTGATPGGAAVPSQAPQQGPGSSMIFIVMGALVFFMLFQSVMGGRRERKARQAMMSSLKKHDKVVTIGGILGSVVDVDEHEVVLRIDENANTRVKFTKASIQAVLNPSTAPANTKVEVKSMAEKAAV